MRKLLLAVALCTASPALADTRSAGNAWEAGFQALNAIDTIETLSCHNCVEANPLFGKHPSAEKLILLKAGVGLIHFAAFKYIQHDDPHAAMRLAQVSVAVQGGIVALNARFMF
jgi:hypothetical protein